MSIVPNQNQPLANKPVTYLQAKIPNARKACIKEVVVSHEDSEVGVANMMPPIPRVQMRTF